MKNKNLRPFVTPIEIIRTIAAACDIKSGKKSLDDQAFKTDIDYRRGQQLLEGAIHAPIKKYISKEVADIVFGNLKGMINEYLVTVGTVSLDGISRNQSILLLLEYYFPKYAANLLSELHTKFGGPAPSELAAGDTRSVKVVIDWLSNNESGWKLFLGCCNKDRQQRVWSWKSGLDLPSSQYIHLMRGWVNADQQENVDWVRVKSLLFIARAIDWGRERLITETFLPAVVSCLNGRSAFNNFEQQARKLQSGSQEQFKKMFPYIAQIQQGLLRTCEKHKGDKEHLRQTLELAKSILSSLDKQSTTLYWLDWHEARWYVMSGDLVKSCEMYKLAFEGASYRSGENQRLIIEEALVVAASQNRPDMVFLKKLKNLAVTIGYELPGMNLEEVSRRSKASDVVDGWEVDVWKGSFKSIFPDSGLFPEVSYPASPARVGPLMVFESKAVKPNYGNPDATVRIGETWKKKMPQLVWFTLQETFDVVERLIQSGASVDAFSDAGDTPILMALEALDVTSISLPSMDDRFFNLISGVQHNRETLNKVTDKRRLLPIISAVKSGRLNVVEKILEMGAEVDRRGLPDNQTALNVCLKLIGVLKNPERFKQTMQAYPVTKELLDSIRRHTTGLSGFSLHQTYEHVKHMQSSSEFLEYEEKVLSLFQGRIINNLNIPDLREIASLLLERGADPNAEHISPLKGYTPLMLAAELDERQLFDKMLIAGGDPAKTYVEPGTGKSVDCWDIAEAFRSKGALYALDAVKQHFRRREETLH